MPKYILALDEGTTGARAILFDERERAVCKAYREVKCAHPRPAYVEQDAEQLFEAQYEAAREVLEKCGVSFKEIVALGITCQRETTVVWEKNTGKPICPAIVWQCRRTAELCEKIKSEGMSGFIRERTGLLPDAYFSATKLAWILENIEGARERAEKGELLFGTVDSFLIYRLTKGKVHATDRTNASRTMLYNIRELCWDKDLLAYFSIPEKMMPEVFPSSAYFGEAQIEGIRLPIYGVAGDQQAALFGQGCTRPGEVKNTYGTGCFMLMHTGNFPAFADGLLTTLAASDGKSVSYALEGSVFTAGSAVKWLRDDLGLIGSAGETEALAKSIPDNGGVYFVPAFTGLGAPYWDMYARGALVGLAAGCGKAEIVRAVIEAMAYRTRDLLKLMENAAQKKTTALKADGGAISNDFLAQFQADILNIPVVRPKNVDLTALGAARLAAEYAGSFVQSPEEDAETVFMPKMTEEVRRKNLLGWERAVKSVRLK